jgi:hypothetical protein
MHKSDLDLLMGALEDLTVGEEDLTVGTDDLTVGGDSDTNRAILIKVKNAAELARSQGAIASFAQALAPATIEGKVYATMRDKLAESLKKENVDAEVTIVEPKGYVAADGKHIASDIGWALGGAGVLAGLWYLFSGRKK